MNYTKEIGKLASRNGIQDITYYIYTPLGPPKAILQISHGMCEYLERYEGFIDYLTGQGFLVCGNDHLGHKNSVPSKDKLGYFAPKNGYTFLVRDLARVTRMVQRQYPDLPFFLLGHSMGSFVARAYLVRYPDLIDGIIICGTSGSNPALGAGSILISIIKAIKGEFYRSAFIDKVMFGKYNSRYDQTSSKFDWLTHDAAIIERYEKDEYCNFLFTASAYKDLLRLLGYVSSKLWYEAVPKELPFFLISGDMDPVGGWGKGIQEVEKKLRRQGLTKLTVKLYKDMRHEILNETGKEEVFKDILSWLEQQLTQAP